MKPPEDKHTDYDQVLDKFDTFFKVRKNLIFGRARFNKCSQQDIESVEQFITGPHSFADNCDFGDLTKAMIRDHIVVEACDCTLSA